MIFLHRDGILLSADLVYKQSLTATLRQFYHL
ncbi:hypothetical protein Q757_02290 [Oenococcus alcoholitolerans]|uniref:Uncharacterized protein n=1 Tax=Oenococcus alcoholitolerans TaxID=931074 RepID=A0ABR4XST7_9LACO|nr:hypothetical protein Q757_02290 [Oenococcus alcoholitolerans]